MMIAGDRKLISDYSASSTGPSALVRGMRFVEAGFGAGAEDVGFEVFSFR